VSTHRQKTHTSILIFTQPHTCRCTPTMWRAMAWSVAGLHSSRTTKKRSKRDMMGGEMATLALSVLERSYLLVVVVVGGGCLCCVVGWG
jgi:hypothetical protein